MATRTTPLTPTEDLEQARRDLDDHGLCIVPGVLGEHELARVRDELYAAAAADRAAGQAYVYDNDEANQRVWALLKRGPSLEALARHPLALSLIEHLLARPFLLSNISANITGPGGGRMRMHADQDYVEPPFPPVPLAGNAIWIVDDFSEANGATRIVLGSHRREMPPSLAEKAASRNGDVEPTVALEAPAGSLCVMDGRVWHQTGTNVTADQTRAGIFAYYVRPFLRTQENWWRSLPSAMLERYGSDPVMRELIGFDHYRSIGIVNGLPLDQPRG
jgi:ectoine hydroxylase-related dioxygenase (phytanoyl-CoA dioxygenase family)